MYAEALEDLAKALNGSHYADRETSVASISGLTIYLEHHEALLKAGILPALMEAIQNPRSVSQVSSLATAVACMPGLPVRCAPFLRWESRHCYNAHVCKHGLSAGVSLANIEVLHGMDHSMC